MCIPDLKMCIYTDNGSFPQFETKYEMYCAELLHSYVILKAAFKNVLFFYSSVS